MQEGKSPSGEKTQLIPDTISQQIENKIGYYESMTKRLSCLLIHKNAVFCLTVNAPQRLLSSIHRSLVRNLSRARNDPDSDPDGVFGSGLTLPIGH